MSNSTSIQQFLDTLNSGQKNHLLDFSRRLQDLQNWRSTFGADLQQSLLSSAGFSPLSQLSQAITHFNQHIISNLDTWDAEWTELAPAQSLAEIFDDKVMLLIFGKFNAGKSSLCNLLAECFRQQGQAVEYFHLSEGHVIYSSEPLREGATETTARLQGVCLGEKLILLDTPGLHSVSAENAALTQRFIDSADGVLWLSSSSSPGQVQELDALARELRRHKPLLPIITRSDQIEEDEVNGEICAVLCNKSKSQRAIQESDVYTRSKEKLLQMQVAAELLKPPVSISAQMVRQNDFNHQAMAEAGFDHLFYALLNLIEPALNYKQRKSAEVFLHYLQEQVLEPIQNMINKILSQVRDLRQDMRIGLIRQQDTIVANTWRTVIPKLPALLEQHASSQDIDAVLKILIVWTDEEISQQIQQHLTDYILQQIAPLNLQLDQHVSYDLISSADTAEDQIIGHDRLYNEISGQLLQALTEQIKPIIDECAQHLDQLEKRVQYIYNTCSEYTQSLARHAQKLRADQRLEML